MKQVDEEKSKKIEQQRSEITKLRREAIENRSEISTLKIKLSEEKKKNQELRVTQRATGGGRGAASEPSNDKDLEEIRALQLAIQFEEQERRQSKSTTNKLIFTLGDREMMMAMMGGMLVNPQAILEQQ